jgi:tRNA-splicing ligase RtcB (3'-phosphate/5'-hydroxy nucleic acid ligase)
VSLRGTAWEATGHPVLVPGSMGAFSYIMRAEPTADASFNSVNHGAGRARSRGASRRELDRAEQQAILDAMDVVAPDATLDEMPDAYKSIDEVVRVCVEGGLTRVVAKCHPRVNAKGDPEDKDD